MIRLASASIRVLAEPLLAEPLLTATAARAAASAPPTTRALFLRWATWATRSAMFGLHGCRQSRSRVHHVGPGR